jgi:hypothetical protein
MQKTGLTFLFWLSTLAGMFIMLNSIGWLLGLLGLAFIPVMILHFVAGTKALNRLPLLRPWVWFSSLVFLLFTLIRPDMDDVSAYTGYSSLLNFFGIRSSRYIHNEELFLALAAILLIASIAIDVISLVKSKRPPPVPVQNEFV